MNPAVSPKLARPLWITCTGTGSEYPCRSTTSGSGCCANAVDGIWVKYVPASPLPVNACVVVPVEMLVELQPAEGLASTVAGCCAVVGAMVGGALVELEETG
jgi:hypothetical protein